MKELRLKKRADRRLRRGHLWVYSNEVDVERTPLREFEAREQAIVTTAAGQPVGTAFVNPATLICARLLSSDPAQPMDRALLVHRLQRARELRDRLFAEPCYRLAYGDSDALPGLVVDRFDDLCVVQIATAGMERLKAEIVEALVEVVNPATILIKNDSAARSTEGLDAYVETPVGEEREVARLTENGIPFDAPVMRGQKSGWFYDHRSNRARLAAYASGRSVLDLFSYVGGWGIQAAVRGARSVTCVDSSPLALEMLAANAALNGVEERIETIRGDVFAVMKELRDAGARFDLVISDPPAFIPRRRDLQQGETAYQRLHQGLFGLMADEGVLITSSCSMHLERARFLELVHGAARRTGRSLQLLEQGHQGPDHPILPAIPETEYLKSLFLRVSPAS